MDAEMGGQMEAKARGVEAFGRGAKRVPGWDAWVNEAIRGKSAKEAVELMGAWLRGWDEANVGR